MGCCATRRANPASHRCRSQPAIAEQSRFMSARSNAGGLPPSSVSRAVLTSKRPSGGFRMIAPNASVWTGCWSSVRRTCDEFFLLLLRTTMRSARIWR
jgi:hypothetical protein